MQRTIESARRILIVLAWLVPVSALNLRSGNAGEREIESAASLLPRSVVAYVHVDGLPDLLRVVSEHPLRAKIEASPVVKGLKNSKDLQQAFQLVGGFEATMGSPAMDAISRLTREGISIGFDGNTEGAVLLLKCSDQDLLERFRGFVLAISQAGTGNFGVLPKSDYRGITAYSVTDDLKLATVGDWMLVTNKGDLGKSVVDRILDVGEASLADKPDFRDAMTVNDPAIAHAYLDIDTIRNAGVAAELYEGRTPNIAAEALFGGVMSNLVHAAYATATLEVDTSGVKVTLATPHDRAWEQGRESFFGTDGNGTAPGSLELNDLLLSVNAHRDLSEMWLRAPDLMTDKGNDELAQADTVLTTLFSGLDFGEDVLGSLAPSFRFMMAGTDFENAKVVPSIRLPSFALEFEMRTPEATTKEFRRVFQSLIGFFNIVGAMNGQPQLDQRLEDDGRTQMVIADYVLPKEFDESGTVPIIYNFSPTIAFSNERMVVSSTESLARQIIGKRTTEPTEPDEGLNTIAFVEAEALHNILSQNREQLIAQNMLENGNSPAKAESEISVLLDLVSLLQNASVALDVSDSSMKLMAEIHVKTSNQ